MSIFFECENNEQLELSTINKIYIKNTYLGNITEPYFKSNEDSSEIYIKLDIDKNTLKSIIDSLKLHTLVLEKNVNLDYFKGFCKKWCMPDWLIDAIYDKQLENKRIKDTIYLINELTQDIRKCEICKTGFNIFKNKYNSCNTHKYTAPGLNGIWSCCNSGEDEEGCLIGYHVASIEDTNSLLDKINKIV